MNIVVYATLLLNSCMVHFCVELKMDALNFKVLSLLYIKPDGRMFNAQLSVPVMFFRFVQIWFGEGKITGIGSFHSICSTGTIFVLNLVFFN